MSRTFLRSLRRATPAAAFWCFCATIAAQIIVPPIALPPAANGAAPQSAPGLNVNAPTRIPRPADAPKQGYVDVLARTQDIDPPWRHFRGLVRIETTDMLLTADSVDFNNDTGDAFVQGHVHYENFITGETLNCCHRESSHIPAR
jgi:lipopolysaccharide assembly outer membrane protein LptD (OstA)